jgi:hypothetical protein
MKKTCYENTSRWLNDNKKEYGFWAILTIILVSLLLLF